MCGASIAGSWSSRTASCSARMIDDAVARGCTLGVDVALMRGAVQAATTAAAHSVAVRNKLDPNDPIRQVVHEPLMDCPSSPWYGIGAWVSASILNSHRLASVQICMSPNNFKREVSAIGPRWICGNPARNALCCRGVVEPSHSGNRRNNHRRYRIPRNGKRGFFGSAGTLAIGMVGCDSNSREGWLSSAVTGLVLIIPDER